MIPFLRDGTSDASIWKEVYQHNLYDVSDFGPNDIVIDVGAHIGSFACLCAEHGAKVLSYEPSGESFGILQKNTEGLSVQAYNQAVWSESKIMPLVHCPIPNAHDGHTLVLHKNGPSEIAVTTTLQEVMDKIGWQRIRLLKLDCEGSEYTILEHAGDVLPFVDSLVVECHIWTKGVNDVRKWLFAAGFVEEWMKMAPYPTLKVRR